MMLSLGNIIIGAQDMCWDMVNMQQVPCSGPTGNLICLDQNTGIQGRCSQMSNGTPVPILTLPEALQQCPSVGCQVVTAAPCDPLFIAAGFQTCQQSGQLSWYTLGQRNLTGASAFDAPITPDTIGLTPADVQYLVQNNLIAPISNSGQTIQPTFNKPTVTSYGSFPPPPTTAVWNSNIAGGTAATTVTAPPVVPIAQAPAPTQTTSGGTVPTGTVTNNPAPGTIPGSNTATGPAPAAPIGTSSSTSTTSTTDTSGDILPGVPNNYLYIGGAVLLLLMLKK